MVNNWNNNRQEQKWVRTNVVAEDHVIIPKIKMQSIENANADAFLESYVSDLTTITLDTSEPLWEVHLLDLKTYDAENVAVLRIHHSVGDGMSLMSLVLACTRKTSNPIELPSLPYQNQSSDGSSRFKTGSRSYCRLFWLVMVLWSVITLVFNTVSDAFEFIATTMFYKDTETPIKGDFRLSKCKRMYLVHRTVSFDDIKLIKNAMKMAGLSQYLKRRYGKHWSLAVFEEKIRALSNTTISFSDLVGPIEEISFYGHPVAYMAPSVYGHPHALTMHFQSYMNKMTISLTVDPTVISDPHRLCDDWEESLRSIKTAVQERSFSH